ncbi:MAG TPA: hypothetical protein DCE44_10445 [Verrucomicrobiales bacterium]|nr:hypothetical protein [Verrucomicrobiales bacterium]
MLFHPKTSSLLVFVLLAGFVQPRAAEPPENHWAFQPLRDTEPSRLRSTSGAPDSPIDPFILEKLDVAKISPAPPATRRALVRRVYFDLIGLPPSPDETEAFAQNLAPDAYSRLVERLLASPRYGERWGRWWLDLARYADSNGQDENKVMANAWRYRDWVVRAFNANLPFDQFITEQLAGDLLPTNRVTEQVLFDRWTATGFLVLGPKMLAEQDKPKLVMDLVDEQIDVVTRAFLGLTVGCARCHDHKFDPIPARDYYALAGIFKSTRAMENLDFVSKFNERRVATREELAGLEVHEKAMAAKTQEIEVAVQQANARLRTGWLQEFPSYLAAATQSRTFNESPREPVSRQLDPVRLKRLTDVVQQDPVTNTLSQVLRELAASPEQVIHRLSALSTNKNTFADVRVGPGKVGGAFVATGSNYLELAHTAALDPDQFSVEMWVRTSEFPKEGDARRWLINKNSNEWVEGHYALVLDQNRPGAYLNIGGGKENVFALWSDGPRLQTNRWHHLAFTYDSEVLRLFVDGKPAGDLAIGRRRKAGTGALALGRRQDGYVNFRGSLDEVRVFDHVLTRAEIAAHCEQPDNSVFGGVVARWEFNDLTEAEQRSFADAKLGDALWGPEGVLALPADPRKWYPEDTRARVAQLEEEPDALKAATPPPPAFALAVADDTPVDLPVFGRGSHLSPGPDKIPRGFIEVANRDTQAVLPAQQSGRLELARWLTSPQNPLTARVIVNRVWQAHFGEGLVRTPDNFGIRGEPPTHPALLDWLAHEFVQSGWDLKHLHRIILNSATYRRSSSNAEPAASNISVSANSDPENRLLGHFPRQRLEAEMVRDALLAVSGRLDLTAGGSLVNWKNNEYVPKDDISEKSVRRSVYLPVVRDRVYDVFTIFDFANPSVGTAKRSATVVSHQALFFLNSPLVQECARALAEALLTAPQPDEATRLRAAYERVFNRPPSDSETRRGKKFLADFGSGSDPAERLASWSAFCQTLLAANEFLYRE